MKALVMTSSFFAESNSGGRSLSLLPLLMHGEPGPVKHEASRRSVTHVHGIAWSLGHGRGSSS